jgi:hypothetical protein
MRQDHYKIIIIIANKMQRRRGRYLNGGPGRGGDPAHDPEVYEAHPAIFQHEEVARMEVRMETLTSKDAAKPTDGMTAWSGPGRRMWED